MNKVNLIGRLTKDPDIRYTQGEETMVIARFTLAVNSKVNKDGKQQADFIPIVAFGRYGELIEKYLFKGNRVGISGHIQTGAYTNKAGVMVYTYEVVVDDIDFLEYKSVSQDQETASIDGLPMPKDKE